MPIMDAQAKFSEDQAITSTGTTNSTNAYDLGQTNNIGPGQPVDVEIVCTEAVTSGGSATLNIQLVQSAAAALTSPDVLGQTGALAKTEFTVGDKWTFQVDVPDGVDALQYIGLHYVVATAALTAGKFTAYITSPQGRQRANLFLGTL